MGKGGVLLEVVYPKGKSIVAQTYRAKIFVTLRPSVLDPAGVAVESGLRQLGYETVEGVRIGKYIDLKLQAEGEKEAQEQLDQMCDRLSLHSRTRMAIQSVLASGAHDQRGSMSPSDVCRRLEWCSATTASHPHCQSC